MTTLLRRITVAGLLALLLSVAFGGVASAHTDVDEYEPGLGVVLDNTPEVIRLRFSNPPDEKTVDVRLSHRDGTPVPLTGDGLILEGTTVTVYPPALDTGTYVIVWESMGADGHLAVGQSYFSVGAEELGVITDLTPRTLAGSGGVGSIVDSGTRLALYGALAVLIGFWWLVRVGLAADVQRARDLARMSAVVLLLAGAVRLVVVASRAGGDEGVVYGLTRILGTTPSVYGWLLLLLGAVAGFVRPLGPVGLLAVAAAGVGEVLSGHMGTSAGAGVLVPATSIHLLGAAFWAGVVIAALVAGGRGEGIGRFAHRFTPWALGSAAFVAVSGVLLTYERTAARTFGDLLGLLDYRYGQLLTGKWLLLLLLVLPLGAYHMFRTLAPAVRRALARDRGDDAGATESRPWNARASVGVEGIGLVLVLALGASLAGQSPTPPDEKAAAIGSVDLLATPETFAECMDPASATDQLLCATRYFEGIVSERGMNAALLEVGDRWREGDPWMQTNCHSIGHKLGRLGFRMFQDIPKAFAAGSDPCDYGYLHGVIEGASADFSDDDLRAAMTNMCEGTGDVNNHGYRQCVHGLGHAAARRVNNDLVRGMEFCREFDPSSGASVVTRESGMAEVLFRLCVTGVSMEWNTQPKARDAEKLPIGADDTLLGECVKLDPIFHPGCIEYGTSAMGGKLEREIEARDWCDANLDDPLPCYQSIGRDVIWSETISDEQAIEVCTGGRGGVYAEQCIIRALGSVATIALDAEAIDEFCPVVPDQYQHLCQMVKEVMEVQIEQTLRGFITEPGGV